MALKEGSSDLSDKHVKAKDINNLAIRFWKNSELGFDKNLNKSATI